MFHRSERLNRRRFMAASAGRIAACGMVAYVSASTAQTGTPQLEITKEQWLDTLMTKKSLSGPLYLFRFVERIYVLTKPIAWVPDPGQAHKRVDVPRGFVTDFASIPRIFWSFLPPDGEYAYAAVLHDYLYWMQSREREESDEILKFAMEGLKVGTVTTEAIHAAVRVGGGGAWDSNTQAKAAGEKRLLRIDKLPNDPATRWEDFRKRQDAFAD
jgi:hypothetical protein